MGVKVFDLFSLMFQEWHKRLNFLWLLYHDMQIILEVKLIREHEKSSDLLIPMNFNYDFNV